MTDSSLLEAVDLRRTFGTGQAAFEAVKGVSLRIDEADTVAIVGPSGSGKSTLCLLYTSDAADEEDSVDLGGRRIIKKKKKK